MNQRSACGRVARKLRIEFAGAIHLVVSRGNRRQVVFADNEDRSLFVHTLGEACAKTRWKVHAYCLMPDHVHLVVETPASNLAAGMKWLLGTYAGRNNRRHDLSGHLFSSRYKSIVIDRSGSYLQTAVDYVHLNPARAGMLGPEQLLANCDWSSLPAFLADPRARPAWLRVESVLGAHRGVPDTRAGRAKLGERLQALQAGNEPAEFAHLRRGWCFGSGRFRRWLLALINQQASVSHSHYGSELREAAEARAEAMVMESMKQLGWRERDLLARLKGDPDKLRIARRVRDESDVTLAWIAQRLHMGARSYLAHLLYWDARRGRRQGKRQAHGSREPSVTRLIMSKQEERSLAAEQAARAGIKIIPLTDPSMDPSMDLQTPKHSSGKDVSVSGIEFDPTFD